MAKKIIVKQASKWEDFRGKKIGDVTDEIISELGQMWWAVEDVSAPIYSMAHGNWTVSDFDLADRCLAVQRMLTVTEHFIYDVLTMEKPGEVSEALRETLFKAMGIEEDE